MGGNFGLNLIGTAQLWNFGMLRLRDAMRKILWVLLLVGIALNAQPSSPEQEVRSAISTFVKALRNLDWPTFLDCWAANPVMFGADGLRIDTRAEFESVWRRGFDRMRADAAARGVTSPPYVPLLPRDVRVDFVGPGVAVVTWHHGPEEAGIRRRMFVLSKSTGAWKITHLHASDVSPAKK